MTESANIEADVATRFRAFRARLKQSQEQLGAAIGGTKRGIQENETGRGLPSGRVLRGLALLGLNVNWLLTGDGPMLMKDLEAGAQGPASPLDEELLQYVLELVEHEQAKKGGKPNPSKKAELVVLLYDIIAETGHKAGPNIDRILRLVVNS
ncbi:helix-turn-helix transcriptional regulator [uncultured Ralstonia sp.]|uniref:helix-turn-helix domain-containing protein n=1 Tax=uncultured Ralstonia sp. TaxID=114715 RepID=UPI0025CC7209|nr:helix-turn-helix transcriptional regulator [uncultured Ralstonia sp.]